MKKFMYKKSRITFLLSLIFLLSTVIINNTQASNQAAKEAIPECWVCD